ncbi:MAG: cobalt ECF transporter T component CbiQ [Propionicimonas sp.]|nr:cobalt ECF transporter T component CbiQ [Propionicimonas sp.]
MAAHGMTLDVAAWASPWRTRSVRDKAVLAGGLLVAAVALPAWPGGLLAGLASLVLLVGPAGLGWRRLGRISWLPLVSILIGVATVAVSVSWDGGVRLAVTPSGLTTAGGLAGRALAAVLAMFLLAATTPMADLLAGLRALRVPDPLIEIAALVYRLTFGLLESLGSIHEAQAARLGYATRRAAMSSAAMASTAIFLRSWDRASRLEAGLAGRGYEDSLRTISPPKRRSTAFLVASLALIGAIGTAAAVWAVVAP